MWVAAEEKQAFNQPTCFDSRSVAASALYSEKDFFLIIIIIC